MRYVNTVPSAVNILSACFSEIVDAFTRSPSHGPSDFVLWIATEKLFQGVLVFDSEEKHPANILLVLPKLIWNHNFEHPFKVFLRFMALLIC